jgi:hypothetical protein
MMRASIGSTPEPGSVWRILPAPTQVIGTLSASTTSIHRMGSSRAKYSAAIRPGARKSAACGG